MSDLFIGFDTYLALKKITITISLKSMTKNDILVL